MRIAIPVAAYHEYNTAVYVARAFNQLGHNARVITQGEFYEDLPEIELFFGVDSAGPLDFPEKHLNKTAMWFIDSRHNCDPQRRQPDDDTNAVKIQSGGGWVFQAQKRDWQRNVEMGAYRSCWLPLAADPDVWTPLSGVDRIFEIGFGGNVWDGVRGQMLRRLSDEFVLLHATGKPELLNHAYAQSKVGFNVSSFYGTPVCYDINMRVFEVMSCGLPLVTNDLPAMLELGMFDGHNCLTFKSMEEAPSVVRDCLHRTQSWRDAIGSRARGLILDGHTYQHRMAETIEILAEAGVV